MVFRRLRTWHARRPNVLATVPTDVSEEEKDIVIESLFHAGAGTVAIVPEPVAAAVGLSLHAADDSRMLIDVGEGVTDVAVLERGILTCRATIRLGCAEMRDDVVAAAAHEGVLLTRRDADAILRDSVSAAAASPAIETIAAFAGRTYRDLEKSTRTRVSSNGVCITGGGALSFGLVYAVAAQLGVRVFRPEAPLRAVIDGARKLLDGEARHVWGGFPLS